MKLPLRYIIFLCSMGLSSWASAQELRDPAVTQAKHQVSIDGFAIGFDGEGNLGSVTMGKGQQPWLVHGGTALDRLKLSDGVSVTSIADALSFTRSFAGTDGRSAVVTDRFSPDRDCIRWEVEVLSADGPWSTEIATRIRLADPRGMRVWTGWGSSGPAKAQLSEELAAKIQAGKASFSGPWSDPLIPVPFMDRMWHYGNVAQNCPVGDDFVVLPLVSLLNPATEAGFSLVLSPADVLLAMTVQITAAGQIGFTRTNHRLGAGKPVRFRMYLVPHEASWRGGLRFLTGRYREYFDPPNPRGEAIVGCGAYSGDENPIDAAKLKKMAFGFNWKLSDDFPYMGMFIPPVKTAEEQWKRSGDEKRPPNKGAMTSCKQLNDYARYMKSNGFAVLNYFNVTEFGKKMYGKAYGEKGFREAVAGPDDPELWKDPVAFLKFRLPKAVWDPAIRTCYSAHVVDPGDPDYLAFLLEQAERHIRLLPDTAGICIDRADHLRRYNPNADDGVSLVNGKPARSLFRSWANLMSQLGPLMHKADRVIFCNLMTVRLELGKELDGIYTEFGQNGGALNASALLGTRKPVIAWTKNETLREPDPDSFMQRHLYLGVFPTAPFPFNNHCIQPTPEADQLYGDYGPLLSLLRGRKWVLDADCISSDDATVHLFKVPSGYVAPVVFGRKSGSVDVRIRLPGLKNMRWSVMHPGSEAMADLSIRVVGEALETSVPLVRGCAMVCLRNP